jgi:hypothetical protein
MVWIWFFMKKIFFLIMIAILGACPFREVAA